MKRARISYVCPTVRVIPDVIVVPFQFAVIVLPVVDPASPKIYPHDAARELIR